MGLPGYVGGMAKNLKKKNKKNTKTKNKTTKPFFYFLKHGNADSLFLPLRIRPFRSNTGKAFLSSVEKWCFLPKRTSAKDCAPRLITPSDRECSSSGSPGAQVFQVQASTDLNHEGPQTLKHNHEKTINTPIRTTSLPKRMHLET